MLINEAAYLKHYGVMGMRWGLRRNQVDASGSSKTGLADVHKKGREIADSPSIDRRKVYGGGSRRDKKTEWRDKVTSKATVDKVLKTATPRIQKDLANLKATTKGRTMTYKQRNDYRRQAQDIINGHLDIAATSIAGLSPGRNSITLRAGMTITDGKLKMRVKPTARVMNTGETAAAAKRALANLEQSAMPEFDKIPDEGLLYDVIEDKDGYNVGFELSDEMAQAVFDMRDRILQHGGSLRIVRYS